MADCYVCGDPTYWGDTCDKHSAKKEDRND